MSFNFTELVDILTHSKVIASAGEMSSSGFENF